MKKVFITIFITLLMLGFSACNTITEEKDSSKIKESSEDFNASVVTSQDTEPDASTETSIAKYPNGVSGFSELIPEGWQIIENIKDEPAKVEGDLNKDNIPDIAAVVEETKVSEAAARAVIIAFGNPDNTYTLSTIAEKAVLLTNEGGVWGDPFESISIDRGSVILKFYGGSNWRWYSTYRFRFQDDDWYLIGATLGSYFTGSETAEEADEEDYNLLTGDYIFKKKDENGKIITTKGNRGIKQLIKLVDFVANSEEKQY